MVSGSSSRTGISTSGSCSDLRTAGLPRDQGWQTGRRFTVRRTGKLPPGGGVSVDLGGLFQPQHTLEVMLRGALMYLVLYLLLRVVLRRELGETGATDILVVVLLADAAQNGMAGRYTSITDGVALVVAILGTSALLDMLSYRWRWFARLIKPRPVMLVRNGQVDRRALRRQLMTMDELWSHLRENGVDSLDAVEEVWMESDGRMSVIPGQSQE